MNYQRIYNAIVAKAQARGPVADLTESHHIVPSCLGGADDKSNLVALSPREHFVAHMCFALAHPDLPGPKFAAWRMANNQNQVGRRYKVNSRLYEMGKRLHREALAGEEWRAKHKTATVDDPEWRAKNKAAMQALHADPEFRAKHKAANQALAADPEWRAKHKAATVDDPEWRAKHKAATVDDPEWRAKHKAAQQDRLKTQARLATVPRRAINVTTGETFGTFCTAQRQGKFSGTRRFCAGARENLRKQWAAGNTAATFTDKAGQVWRLAA